MALERAAGNQTGRPVLQVENQSPLAFCEPRSSAERIYSPILAAQKVCGLGISAQVLFRARRPIPAAYAPRSRTDGHFATLRQWTDRQTTTWDENDCSLCLPMGPRAQEGTLRDIAYSAAVSFTVSAHLHHCASTPGPALIELNLQARPASHGNAGD